MGVRRPKFTRLNPLQWPLALRVPVLAALMMVTVSAVVTDRVLTRLIDTQNRHLTELSDAYLDGISSAVIPHVLREDIWEVYDALDRAAQRYEGLDIAWTTVTDPVGRVIASSQPRAFPLQTELPDPVRSRLNGASDSATYEDHGVFHVKRELVHQHRVVGAIYAEMRIGTLIEERREVLATLIASNTTLTLLFAIIGYITVRRMMRPIRVLSESMRSGAAGSVTPVPVELIGRPESEFGQLFRRYNSLVQAVAERERLLKSLAEEERLAALGRLASGMAHEINNPIGGMLNAVDSLKRHGDRAAVRETSIRLIEKGLLGIRDIVRSSLATYRHRQDERPLTATDLDDLALLLQPEIKRKNLQLEWRNAMDREIFVPVGGVRDAALNLLLNACAATEPNRTVSFEAAATQDGIELEVRDQGPGMPRAILDYINAPLSQPAPLAPRSGLGLWMVKRFAYEVGGQLEATTRACGGTSVRLKIPERKKPFAKTQELSHVA